MNHNHSEYNDMKKIDTPDLSLGFIVCSESGQHVKRDFYLFPLKTPNQQPAGAYLYEVLSAIKHPVLKSYFILHGYIDEKNLRDILYYKNNPSDKPCSVIITKKPENDLIFRGLSDIKIRLMTPEERTKELQQRLSAKIQAFLKTPQPTQQEIDYKKEKIWKMTFSYAPDIQTTGQTFKFSGYRRLKNREN